VIFEAGLGLWLIYGIVLHDWPMILANTITISLCSLLMLIKVRYSKSAAKVARAEAGQ